MKTLLRGFTVRYLLTLLFSTGALSLLSWSTGTPLHMAALVCLFVVWTALLTAADRLGRFPAAAALLALSVAIPIMRIGRAELFAALVDLFAQGAKSASLLTDTVLALMVAVLALAALYLLPLFWPRLVLCLGWAGFWAAAAWLEKPVPKLALAALMPVVLFTIGEGIYRARFPRDRESFRPLAAGLMTLSCLGLLLGFLPTSPKPYGYPLLHTAIDRVNEFYRSMEGRLFFRQNGNGQFELSFNGFDDQAHTDRQLEDQNQPLLFARAQMDTAGALYLVGNTWDTFIGTEWTNELDEDVRVLLSWNMDTAERLYALWRDQTQQDQPTDAGAFFRENNVVLYSEHLNSHTLFVAPGTLLIRADDKRYPYHALPGSAQFDYEQQRSTSYQVYYLEQNPDTVPGLIARSEGYEYGANTDVVWGIMETAYAGQFSLSMRTSLPMESTMARRQVLIRRAYLGLPADLSDDVRALAREITAGCETDYEKLLAIESYLHDHFRYTTSPALPPKGTPMLDHLLFDTQEGYCTWYATAATILARCVDIPARYVQGYRVALNAGEPVRLLGRDSHAWCEGYIPGYGWVTVEATPGFSAAGPGWEHHLTAPAPSAADGPSAQTAVPIASAVPAKTPAPIISPDPAPSNAAPRRTLWPVLGLIGLLAAGLLLWAVRRLRTRRAGKPATFADKTLLDLQRFLRLAARLGFPRAQSESLRQYFARFRWDLLLVEESLAGRMGRLYEQTVFAARPVTREEWLNSRAFLAAAAKGLLRAWFLRIRF